MLEFQLTHRIHLQQAWPTGWSKRRLFWLVFAPCDECAGCDNCWLMTGLFDRWPEKCSIYLIWQVIELRENLDRSQMFEITIHRWFVDFDELRLVLLEFSFRRWLRYRDSNSMLCCWIWLNFENYLEEWLDNVINRKYYMREIFMEYN